MFGGLLEQSRSPIGVDVGAHTIRMVQLLRKGEGWMAYAAAECVVPDDVPVRGGARTRALAPLVRAMLSEGNFHGNKVVSCLPSAAIMYKNVRLPEMPADELRAAVEWEATERLNVESGSTAFQFFDAGNVRQGDETRREVILLAASHRAVDDHVELLTECGLHPLAIDAVPAALARCVCGQGIDTVSDEARMVIEIGYTSTNVLIVRSGRVVFFKRIDVGGKSFDRQIADKLGIELLQASSLRRTYNRDIESPLPKAVEGKVKDAAAARDVIAGAVWPIGSELAREVALCVRYFSVTFRGNKPQTAYLVGGESNDRNLAAVLADQSGIEITQDCPLTDIDLSASDVLLNDPNGLRPWVVATGLAMRPTRRAAQRKRGAA